MATALTLPDDIWLIILADFTPEAPFENGRFRWPRGARQGVPTDLLSLRSTCRTLREVVDPLLLPIMYVDLNQRSMDRIDHLSRNPDIARGVHGVEINLSLLPASYASNLKAFSALFQNLLQDVESTCDYHTEFDQYEADDESEEARRWWALQNVMRISHSIQSDIRAYVSQPNDSASSCESPTTEQPERKYRHLLDESFAIYKTRLVEQQQIIDDQIFVRTVAMAISRFKRPVQVALVDSVSNNRVDEQTAKTITDDLDTIRRHVLRTHQWVDIERRNADTDSVPAHILVELLMACDKASVPLQTLDVGCFPLVRNFGSLISPSNGAPYRWSDLTQACRKLRRFTLGDRGLNHTPRRKEPIGAGASKIIQRFLGAVCSGPFLESIELKMIPFRECNNSFYSSQPRFADLHIKFGSIAGPWTSPVLSYLTLLDFAMSSAELEAVIGKLAPRPKYVGLISIDLESGAYAKAISILRQKVSDTEMKVASRVHLSTLQGGEFGPPQPFPDSSKFFGGILEEGWLERYEQYSTPPLLKRVLEYLTSEEELPNPLEEVALADS